MREAPLKINKSSFEEEKVIVATNTNVRMITTDMRIVDTSDNFNDILEDFKESTELEEFNALQERIYLLMDFYTVEGERIVSKENDPIIRYLRDQWEKLDSFSAIVMNRINKKTSETVLLQGNDNNKKSVELKSDRVNKTLGYETTEQIPNPWANNVNLGVESSILPPSDQQYATQLNQLLEMGFEDSQLNLTAITLARGNIAAAVEWILRHK